MKPLLGESAEHHLGPKWDAHESIGKYKSGVLYSSVKINKRNNKYPPRSRPDVLIPYEMKFQFSSSHASVVDEMVILCGS